MTTSRMKPPARGLRRSIQALVSLVVRRIRDLFVGERVVEAEARLAALVEHAPDGIFVADLQGRYTEVNDAGCRMLGYTRGEIVGKTIVDLIPPEQVERLWESKTQMLDGAAHVDEWLLRRKDGTWLPVEVSAKILADGRWQGFVRDTSERQRLEWELRKSHADLERAQAVASVGSWSLDVRRNELQWSAEGYRIFGIPQGTPLTYEVFLGCVHPDDRAYVDQTWKAALQGAPYDIVHRVVVGSEIKWVREKADLDYDERGVLRGGVGISEDITEHKRLEDALRLAEARASGILAISADAIISIDDEQRITRFNAGAEKKFGFTEAEAIGAPLDILIPERFRASHRQLVNEFAAGQEVARRMGRRNEGICGLRKSGEEFPAEASISKLEVGGERILTVALRDVTEQRNASDQIRESRERLELALKGANLAAWDWNIETGEVILSPRWAEMRGFRPDQVRPHVDEWVAGVHPDDMPRVQQVLSDHFEGLRPEYEVEHRVRTASGEWMWILDLGKVSARNQRGEPIRMVGVELDITAQRRNEQEQSFLAELGSVLASTLDYEETTKNIARLVTVDLADVCIVDTLEDGGQVRRLIVTHGEAGNASVARDLQELEIDRRRSWLGSSVFETAESVLMADIGSSYLESIAQSDDHLRVLHDLHPKSLMALPLMAHGRLQGAVVLIRTTPRRYTTRDLRFAERVALRAALAVENAHLYNRAQRAIRARDDILGIVAHDLRNPLGTILMQAGLLHDPGAEVIARAGARMNRLIQDLLDVTCVEAGQLFIERNRLVTGQLVADALEAQRSLAAAAALELRLDLPPQLPDICADRDRLLQVFENLISNAVKCTKPGGRITVGAEPRDSELLFWVADTGVGIAAEAVPRLFDRFWQAGKARRHGAGLGLSIAKGIVEAHGGRIWVESAPGRGSCFFFTIPTEPVGASAT